MSFRCYNYPTCHHHSYKTGFYIPPKHVYKIISFAKRLRSFACLPLLFLLFYSLLKQLSFCGYVIFIATDCHGITRHVRAVPCLSVAITNDHFNETAEYCASLGYKQRRGEAHKITPPRHCAPVNVTSNDRVKPTR